MDSNRSSRAGKRSGPTRAPRAQSQSLSQRHDFAARGHPVGYLQLTRLLDLFPVDTLSLLAMSEQDFKSNVDYGFYVEAMDLRIEVSPKAERVSASALGIVNPLLSLTDKKSTPGSG